MISTGKCSLFAIAAAAVCFAVPAGAQVTCTASSNKTKLVRAEGYTELAGDVVLVCTGGVPTAAGGFVPQVNVQLFLNTNATSEVTAADGYKAGATLFNEALLLVDEPNRAVPVGSVDLGPSHNILNCGNKGAPDVGPSGPNVCTIVSDGNPADTYDGTPAVQGADTATCTNSDHIALPVYGCGRPNVYQGRLATSVVAPSLNQIQFLGVPFDAPGVGKNRILRFTNLRVDSAMFYGLPNGTPIFASIAISGVPAVTVTPQNIQVGATGYGLQASVPAAKVLRLTEGYAGAWKTRDLAVSLSNSTYVGPGYAYTLGSENLSSTNIAQNVPAIDYHTESGFQWNITEAQPSPNPPQGYGPAGAFAGATNYPLNSFYVPNSGIGISGAAFAGTRFALHFLPPGGETITLPTVVNLFQVASPFGPASGVMVLMHNTQPDGSGGTPAPGSTLSISGGTVVYEVLYSNPSGPQFADVKMSISGLGVSIVTPSFAPFYVPSASPNPNSAVPPGFTFLQIPRFNCGASIANVPCVISPLLRML